MMLRTLVEAGMQVPLAGARIGLGLTGKSCHVAGELVKTGVTGVKNASDIVEIGRTAVQQAPLIARLCTVLKTSPEAALRLVKATEENAEGMVEMLESVLRNPELLAFVKEMGQDPARFRKLLEMGKGVAQDQFPADLVQSTSQNAETLRALMRMLQRNPKLTDFAVALGNNPMQLNKLLSLSEKVLEGASPMTLFQILRQK